MPYRQHEVRIPHFSIPFSFSGPGSSALVSEQGTFENVADQAKTIIAFPIGSRLDHPDFGSPDLLFREKTENIADIVSEVLNRWIDGADISVEESIDIIEEYKRMLHVNLGTGGS